MKEKKKKIQLNAKMARIIMIINEFGGKMTPNEISEETGISFVTVKKHLEILKNKEVIIEEFIKKTNKKIKHKTDRKVKRYSLNYNKIYSNREDIIKENKT